MWSDNPFKYKGLVTKINDKNYLFIILENKLTDGIPIIDSERFYDKLTKYDSILVYASFYDGTQPVILEPLLENFDFTDIFIKLKDVFSFKLNRNKNRGLTVENVIIDDMDTLIEFLLEKFEEILKNNLQIWQDAH